MLAQLVRPPLPAGADARAAAHAPIMQACEIKAEANKRQAAPLALPRREVGMMAAMMTARPIPRLTGARLEGE